MWALTIVVVAAILALLVFGAWIIAVPLSLVALGIGLFLRLSGRVADSGELRRFRSRAGDAAPDQETLAN